MSFTGAGGVSLGPCLHGVMSMRKKIVAFAIALVVAISCLTFPVSAAPVTTHPPRPGQGEHYNVCPHCGTFQLQGLATKHDYCPVCGCYLVQIWGGGGTRGGGAGRGYYTTPDTSSTTGSGSESGGSSSSGSNNKYLTGVNNTLNKVYNIINETNNTINYVINNTTYNYTYNNYTYNNEYNYYTFNNIDNSTNYYVTNYVTYSVVSVPQEGTGGTTGNPVKYDNVILYYQLPDGRNSYNLTADDVFGTYFVYDMVNYDTVAEDDGTTLALYHFDGDLKDSSAHAGTATYTAGAEYNFVESTFGGALDWSATQHTLNFTLPEEIGTGDFTIEFYLKYPGLVPLNVESNQVIYNTSWAYVGSDAKCSVCGAKGYFVHSGYSYSSGASRPTNPPAFVSPDLPTSMLWSETTTEFTDTTHFGKCFHHVYSPVILKSSSSDFLFLDDTPFLSIGYQYNEIATGDWSSQYFKSGSSSVYWHKCSYIKELSSFGFLFDETVPVEQDLPLGRFCFSFVRNDGICTVYVNGLAIASGAYSVSVPNSLTLSTDQGLTIDEFRVSNKALYDGTYTPSAQPFDTNKVLVTPSSGQPGDIAVKSNVPVSQYRVGGVRPTYPTDGYVYVYLEGDTVKNIQQYQTDGWYDVDASIYAVGDGWQNLKNYDLSTYTVEDPQPTPSPTPDVTPDPGSCTHDYQVTDEKAATCTTQGSKTYTCSLCGDTYTDMVKALGHDWHIVSADSPTPDASSTPESSAAPDTTPTPEASAEPGTTPTPGTTEPPYTLYRCSRCGAEYKDYDGTGPPKPPADDDSGDSWWDKLVSFVKGLIDGFGKLVSLAMDALSSILGLLTDFAGVLASLYGWLPSSWQLILTAGFACVLLIGVIKLFF